MTEWVKFAPRTHTAWTNAEHPECVFYGHDPVPGTCEMCGEYHQDKVSENDANGRSLMYPGPDGLTAYRDGYEVGPLADCGA